MKDKRKMMMVVIAQKQKANRKKERCTHTQHNEKIEKLKNLVFTKHVSLNKVSSLVQRKEEYNFKKLKVFI